MNSRFPQPGHIHLWFAHVDLNPALLGALEATLSVREIERASRFVFDRHRIRYIFAQGVLRSILGAASRMQPAAVSYLENRYGKPLWPQTNPGPQLHFNMSHSKDLVAVGLAAARIIGVDVEFIRPVHDLDALAEDNYAPSEIAMLRQAPESERQDLFFRFWTRKESYIRAVGKGLSIPLNSFDTCSTTLGRTMDAPEVASWRLADLETPAGYRGAVTIEDGFNQIDYFEWSPELSD